MRFTPAAALFVALSLGACQDVENVLTSEMALIQVQNLRGSPLTAVYTPPCTGGDPGANQLTGGSVPHGGLSTFWIEPGCYDVIGEWGPGVRQTVQDVRAYADVQSRVVFSDL